VCGARRAAFFLADQATNREQQPQLGVDGLDVADARSLVRGNPVR